MRYTKVAFRLMRRTALRSSARRPAQPEGDPGQATVRGAGARLHPDVFRLGVVSLLTDVSSEMIFAVFAIFFTTIAAGSAALLGVIEGLADFASCALDYLAGWLSDRSGRRKALAVFGYGFSTLAKLILLVANSVPALGAFRIVERLGKSFRGPPRDAWLASVAAPSARGYAFGVHKALDKSGAVLGPLLAWFLLHRLGATVEAYRTVFRVAFVPALLAVVLLLFLTERSAGRYEREPLLSAWRTLPSGFKRYLGVAAIFSLGYFSFGFLLLRAYQIGFSLPDTVLLYTLFNATFVVAAPWVGRLGDRIGRGSIVLIGYLIYLLMNVGFAVVAAKWELAALFAVYGVFYAIDEAQSRAFIADLESQRRATAVGAYNFLTGSIYLLASIGAGLLWAVAPTLIFMLAALTSAGALIALVRLQPWAR